MSKPTIKLLSEYFHPEPASTGQLMTQLAVGLKQRGFEVDAYTSQPTYQGQEKDRLPPEEEYQGVTIRRVFGTQLEKKRPLGRICNWLSFTFSTLFRLLFDSNREDILLIVSNPPIIQFVGLLLNLLRGQRYVLIIYDVYPDMAVNLGFVSEGSLTVNLWNRLNRWLYNHADRIVVLGEVMKKTIIEKAEGKVEPEKIQVIHNWEDPNFIEPKEKSENSFALKNGYDNTLTVLYSGNLGQHHDLETLIMAADRVKGLPIQFVFIGDGAQKDKLKGMVRERDLKNVDFHPYQPKERLSETLTCGDVSVVSEDKRAEGLCVSVKIYSSLAAGQAILGLVGEKSDVARIIRGGNCGLRADQGDAERVAEHLRYWLQNEDELEEMGENARNHFENNFTSEKAIGQYSDIVKYVIEG